MMTTPTLDTPETAELYREEPPVSREQVARWQSDLEQVVPRSENMTWLYLRWEPGDPWQPVQRWCLWEMIPVAATPPSILAALRGPHPRSTGFFNIRTKRWCDGPAPVGIDRATWELYQETGQWGMRWWAIQGKGAGHPLAMPWVVKVVKKLLGEPEAEPPAIGDLPYRLPDADVWQKVAMYDRYRAYRDKVGDLWEKRTMDDVSAEMREAAERGAAEVTAWWDAQVGEVLDEYPRQALTDIGWEAMGAARNGPRLGPVDNDVTTKQALDVFGATTD